MNDMIMDDDIGGSNENIWDVGMDVVITKVIKHRRKSQIQRKNPNENMQSYMYRMHIENNAYLCTMHMHSGEIAYVYASTGWP